MSQQGGGGSKGMENFLLGLLGAAFALTALIWVTGYVSAQLFNGATLATTPGEMPTVLGQLAQDPGNPNIAFPGVGDSQAIPGAFAFYFIFVILIVALVSAGLGIYRLAKGGGTRNALGHKNTQWAKRSDLKTLIVREPQTGRLTLGSVGNTMIATEQRHSVIVLGPTQSGKTTGLAVPAILEWDGPVIATSVKNDLAENTLAWRQRMGEVWVYDPTATTGLPVSTWSPLDGARDWSGAKKIASWLTNASKSGGKGGLQDGDFWYSAAGKLLAPHLFAAAANGYTMADVVRWIDTQEEFEVRSLLQATGVEEAIMAAEASWQREDRARSSIYTTAEVVIEAYSDPTVLASARTSEIRAQRFLDGGNHTLYVCAPSHEQDRLRPVFSTLLKQIIRAAYDAAPLRPSKRLDPTLLIVLDEAANIAPLDDLDTIASTCSGLGIQLVTVWQDLSQINNRYGDRANTVVNNHRAKIVLSGISDPATLDYVSRLIGSEEVRSTSTTIDGQGSKSTTTSNSDKNLAPSDVIRRIKMNEGVLVYGALLPARLRLRPWYRSKRLTAMVNNKITPPRAIAERSRNTAGDSERVASYDDGAGGYDDGTSEYDDFRRSPPVGVNGRRARPGRE